MKMRTGSKALLLCALSLVAALLPSVPAAAAPSVQLLNPSDYSPTPRISTKEDANGDRLYHIVAYVGEVPANPAMEFELALLPVGGGETVVATFEATRVGTTDTWEGELSTTGIADGQYVLRAILYGNFPPGEEVARDQVPVTIQSSGAAAANTVELSYPSNGGLLGFWKSGDAPGVAVLRGFASVGTNRVRALYTTSAPGTDPEWTECGTATPSDKNFTVRCTLADKVNPSAVKAVAVVANSTPPPAPPPPSADEAGDAHRVFPYLQNPGSVDLEPDSDTVEQGTCKIVVATVLDTSGIPIPTMNVDVHAQGPDDQLRFATQQVNGSNRHDGFQAPDNEHSGNEATGKCSATDPNGRQGDHNVPVGDDIKHIESTTGTNNAGQFRFILLSGTKGGTQITAWADENDDDSLNTATEAAGYGQLGWGEAPPPPQTTLNIDPSSLTSTVGECEQFTVSAQQNGSPRSGQNVDIHITGPSGVNFCDPGGGTTSAPDSGGHIGDNHPGMENTKHNEGTTDGAGFVVFGVTSSNEGQTSIVAWLDENNDDVQGGEESIAAASVEWQQEGGRSISIRSSRSSVRKGGRVKLSGRISGANSCANNQTVKIQARRDGRFRSIKKTTTDGSGSYATRVRVRRTTKYRALAPRNGPCDKAISRTIRVRTT